MDKIKFVDANIFLELMLDDDKAEECENFFKKIKNKEIEAVTSDFILYTCIVKIEQKLKSVSKIEQFLFYINQMNLHIIRPLLGDMINSLKISEKYKLDFDDSFIISLMINNNIKELVSFDKHFDKVNLIRREVP